MKQTHLNREQRRQHWQKVYAEKSPLTVSWYQEKPTLSLRLIQHAAIASDAPVIDVGGGASRLVDHLQADGFTDLTVLDVSAEALQHAQRRAGTGADRIEWLVCDITEFEPSRCYALWHDRAALHFLTENNDRQRYLAVLKKAIAPGGHVVLATFAPDGPSRCSGLDIVQYDGVKISSLLGNEFALLQQCMETHHTPAGNCQQFAYFHFKRQSQEN